MSSLELEPDGSDEEDADVADDELDSDPTPDEEESDAVIPPEAATS